MTDFDTQIAEFTFPFPAKIFEKELKNRQIEYSCVEKDSYEGGMGSCIFYIRSSDFERAIAVREKVDKENAESEQKHVHPIRKIISYLGILIFLVYVFYKIWDIFYSDN